MFSAGKAFRREKERSVEAQDLRVVYKRDGVDDMSPSRGSQVSLAQANEGRHRKEVS